MEHDVKFMGTATAELDALKAFDRKRILQQIERQLVHQPAVVAKNRKCLDAVSPGFDYDPPLWELRVGDFRIFDDVNAEEGEVTIRAVRAQEPRTAH